MSQFVRAAVIGMEMIDRRNALRTLHGDRYAELTRDAKAIVKAEAKLRGVSILDAALAIAKQAEDDGD